MSATLRSDPLVQVKPLSLNGTCSYSINGEQLVLNVEEVANNRPADNTSGSLSLEMWALPEPYRGGDFGGCQVAAVDLGALHGQRVYRQLQFSLPLQTPGVGTWYMVMMLREWDNGSYLTRDYINFPEAVKAQYKITLSLDGVPVIYRS